MSQGVAQFEKVRLKEVREARGLTGFALADLVGVNKSSISHYESGTYRPTLDTLQRVADVLRVPIHYFYLPAKPPMPGLLFWRSQSAATRLERDRAARRYEWLVTVTTYMTASVSMPTVRFPNFQIPDDPRELTDRTIEEVARQCRMFWSLGTGPISNVVLLLENNGAVVARCEMGTTTLDAFSHWNPQQQRPYFVLGSDKGSAARSVFDAAHELAHMVLHRGVESRLFNMANVHKLMEHQAMLFAGAFLLPAENFAADLHSVSLSSFLSLKAKWRVAIQAMIMRATHLGLVSQADAKSLWISLTRRGWKVHEPLDDTMEIERPRMLQRCFDVLMDGSFDPNALSAAVALPLSDIEEVCGLPPGYLSRSDSFKFRLKF